MFAQKPVSKTTYLDFLTCPKNAWLKNHRPDLADLFAVSDFDRHLIEQGYEAEAFARNLFPGGVEVQQRGEEAAEETLRLMTAGAPAIFQATFIVDGFLVRNDALVFDAQTKCWDLYEVKGTSSVKENGPEHDHIDDLSFQVSVLKRAHVLVGRFFLVHLNKEYVRKGAIDVKELFTVEDQSEKVAARLSKTEEQMKASAAYLAVVEEPDGGCRCVYKGRSRHCETFEYSHPHVPGYSVHDISNIGSSKKKLESFVERNIFDLNDIPEDSDLTDRQWNQVRTYQKNTPEIHVGGISGELEKLSFPLYFLDYETFAPAIPIFDGYRPYQRIPFQLSLHILKEAGASLEHAEYLHDKLSDPSEEVAKLLEAHVGPEGTIIAWNKAFEAGVNKELAMRLPAYAALFERINGMLYDLCDVFQKQHYIHPAFRGSVSIKKVLPALVPELQYKDLSIKEGGQASDAWWRMVSPATTPDARAKIASDLKIYCGLDTEAMVAIWRHLYAMI